MHESPRIGKEAAANDAVSAREADEIDRLLLGEDHPDLMRQQALDAAREEYVRKVKSIVNSP